MKFQYQSFQSRLHICMYVYSLEWPSSPSCIYMQTIYSIRIRSVCICICVCGYIRMVILQYSVGDTNLCCTYYYARRFATIFVFFYSCCKQITKCISYFIFRIELVVSSSSLSVFPIFATRDTHYCHI